MAATQLWLDFTEPAPSSPITSHAQIIPFPVPPQKTNLALFHLDFSFHPYGAWVSYNKRLSSSERLRINNEAIALLSKPHDRLSSAELDTLRSYSGWGGLSASDERGVLYDYYTSPPIASLAWHLLNKLKPIEKNALILEPSCGTGVFFFTGPQDVFYNGVELDERTASIASILHPDAFINPKSYEAFNLSGDNVNRFDHVIGNAPFGERTLETAFMDMPEEKSLDRYFITRSLDNLKPSGTMALIVHSGILPNKSNAEWRVSINKKAQFMGAVKLNDSSFNHTHTSIQPDILLFKKHPENIEQLLQTFSASDFTSSELAQGDWIDGTYFSSRPQHVMGTVQSGKGQWGSDVVSGDVTPETLQAMLDTFIPEQPISEQAYEDIRNTISLPDKNVKTSILPLTKDEIEAVEQKFLLIGSVKAIDSAVYILSDSYRWIFAKDDTPLAERIKKVLSISADVKALRMHMREGRASSPLQGTIKNALDSYKDLYGDYPKDDPVISRFVRNYPSLSGIYDALIDPSSDILSLANLYDNNGVPINGHNRAVEVLLFLQKRMLAATVENINQYFPDEKDELVLEMYRNPDIFFSEQRTWQLREDFISGDAWGKIDALNSLAANEEESAQKEKWLYGISELEKAVGWIPIEEADFSPHSSWIPEDIINAWVRDEDGLDRPNLLEHGSLKRNESGKWGILYFEDHSVYDSSAKAYRNVSAGQWEELANEIVYTSTCRSRGASITTPRFLTGNITRVSKIILRITLPIVMSLNANITVSSTLRSASLLKPTLSTLKAGARMLRR
jgi:hypothetical protein